MSASVSPNVDSESSEHKTSAVSPVLLTFLSGLLKTQQIQQIFFFQFWVLTLRISPQLQQRRASQQPRQFEPDHRCRGWAGSTRVSRDVASCRLVRLAETQPIRLQPTFLGCLQDIGHSFRCLNMCSLFTYGWKTAWRDRTRNIFELITSIWAFDMFTDTRVPTNKHTRTRAQTSELGFTLGIVWVWSAWHVNTRGPGMRETRTDESRVCVAKAVLARLTSPSLKKSSWVLLLSLILLFSPTLTTLAH